tara:strand:- start:303 stop:437 length:135 start_codon:yes stop_codon:yes gene_type:complete
MGVRLGAWGHFLFEHHEQMVADNPACLSLLPGLRHRPGFSQGEL